MLLFTFLTPFTRADVIIEEVAPLQTSGSTAGTIGADGGIVLGTDGNFYGTTHGGPGGWGSVFKVTPAGLWTTLVAFNLTNNGGHPYSCVIQANDGNFYGTTQKGISNSPGMVYRMTPSGAFTPLFLFNNTNGNFLNANLVQGSDGNLYGAAEGGAYNHGTLFKLTLAGELTTLVSFDQTNGSEPNSLVEGSDGNFYGTTYDGGTNNLGTIFKITPSGTLTSLASFNAVNGEYPQGGSLVEYTDGSFYGVTSGGGTNSYGGTVFKITPSGTLTSLYSFGASLTNGYNPLGSLLLASDGNFYGTTHDSIYYPNTYGTIFKMTPAGTLTTLARFNTTNGAYPFVGLIQVPDGTLYGVSHFGGSLGQGNVYKISAGLPPVIKPRFTASSFDGNGVFQLNVNGPIGLTHLIEASSDLLTWSMLGMLTNNNGTLQLSDPASTNSQQRFYRFRAWR